MKKYNKNIVVFLMTMSQLLITLFVIYWLLGQYKEEKHLLHRELNRGFIASERMMIDTMLATYLIDPLLNDSSANFKISISLDSTSKDYSNYSKAVVKPYKIKDHLRRIDFSKVHRDTINRGDSLSPEFKEIVDTTYSFLFRGARMILGRMRGLDHNEVIRATFLKTNADTLVLQNSFINHVHQKHPDFKVVWISNVEGRKLMNNRIALVSHVLESNYAAEIEHYQVYLLKTISPQILFAFVLLLITTASFRISYLSIRKQQRLLKIKDEFISNISHELKTPVSTVKVALEALLDFDMKKDPAVVQDYLEMSLLEMNRLDLLVSKVLNNAVLENGNELFSSEKVNLYQLIEEVIQSQKYRVEKEGAEINFNSELKDAIVKLDKLHIQGVLLNLIDNSLKYAGSSIQIELALNRNKTRFTISVKDNGPGIPNEYIDKVFDKFFRVPTNDRHNVKGYGLGLNYAKLVMQHHEGSISVKNLAEGGCEFVLTIPTNPS